MALRLAAALAFLAVTLLGGHPQAADVVHMKDHYQGPDLAFVYEFFYDSISFKVPPGVSAKEHFNSEYNKHYPKQQFPSFLDPEEAVHDIIHVGYFDLNDDGQYEMILQFDFTWTCTPSGPGGCATHVFEKHDGRWQRIGGTSMYGIEVTDERVGGYRTLKSSYLGLRWDLERNQYWDFCMDPLTGIEGAGRCLEEQG